MSAEPAKNRNKKFREILQRWKDFYQEPLIRLLRHNIRFHRMTKAETSRVLNVSPEYISQEYGQLWKEEL